MKSREIKLVFLYRIIAAVFPLKYRLNFLISSYLRTKQALLIPYYRNFGISILSNPGNQRTISDLIFEGAGYLPEFSLMKKIKRTLGSNFTYVDVGSNIGTTVWLFAKEAGKVFAFEPIPKLCATIQDSIDLNNATNVVLINKAIGNCTGVINMLNSNNSSIVKDTLGDIVEIPISTLDIELQAEGKIDFIKIDVEGFELKVLEGAVNIIQKHRPILLIELHPGFIQRYGDDCKAIIDFIELHGYRITYYSFLQALRMSRLGRVINRWFGSPGKSFKSRQQFFDDLRKVPELSSYHLYCEPD